MSKNYPQILHAPDEANRLGSQDSTLRFSAADLAERTALLKARIAELEAELASYRSSRLGAIDDQEIQEIISNL